MNPIIRDCAWIPNGKKASLDDSFNRAVENNLDELHPDFCYVLRSISIVNHNPRFVIVGQDPYAGKNGIHPTGIAFHTKDNVRSVSLVKLSRCLLHLDEEDLCSRMCKKEPNIIDLQRLASAESFLMLNAALTHDSRSIAKRAAVWFDFVGGVLKCLKKTPMIFFGKYAEELGKFVGGTRAAFCPHPGRSSYNCMQAAFKAASVDKFGIDFRKYCVCSESER